METTGDASVIPYPSMMFNPKPFSKASRTLWGRASPPQMGRRSGLRSKGTLARAPAKIENIAGTPKKTVD